MMFENDRESNKARSNEQLSSNRNLGDNRNCESIQWTPAASFTPTVESVKNRGVQFSKGFHGEVRDLAWRVRLATHKIDAVNA